MLASPLLRATSLLISLRYVLAVGPLVELGYTTYLGTELQNGVTQWLGMRFATPPLGDLRFRAPEDPPAIKGVQSASAVSTFFMNNATSVLKDFQSRGSTARFV